MYFRIFIFSDFSSYILIQFRHLHLAVFVIHSYFFINRLVDNLPAATRVLNPDTNELQFEHGYRLGRMFEGKHYINNHLKLILWHHKHTP